jgi:wyosine [tRNA(Phe)-imidazoG37] synthetase (radical SAM superfamily)
MTRARSVGEVTGHPLLPWAVRLPPRAVQHIRGGRLDYRDHRRELGANRYVYAVVSRRARGLSIGVNLNPDKACNFDCPYCQVDRTTPGGPSSVAVDELAAELEDLLLRAGRELWAHPPFNSVAPELRRVADVAFAGDGEPTTPPEFPAAVAAARELRDRLAPGVPLRLLTNATLFHKDRVRAALAGFDELWCKLDAGSEAYFQAVDGTRLPFRRILDNLLLVARERPIVIQSLFLTLEGAGPDDAEISAWVERLRGIVAGGGRIDHVQVYTVARAPSDPRCGALGIERLEAIASAARQAGLTATVYG